MYFLKPCVSLKKAASTGSTITPIYYFALSPLESAHTDLLLKLMQQSHRPQSSKRQTNAGSSAGPSPIKVTKLNTDARPLTADEYRMYGSLVNKLRHGK